MVKTRRRDRIPAPVMTLAVLVAVGPAGPAGALPTCGVDDVIELSGIPILPFGGEILGASILEGTVVDARVDVTFTATGSFDAADLGFSLNMPVDGAGGAVGFTGAGLGWSGQGTFTASLVSDGLDGDLSIPADGSFYSWFAIVSNLDPGSGPITGVFDDLRVTLTFADCPPGDLDGDIAVDFADLVLLLAAWGAPGCNGATPCAADIDGNGVVDFVDLLALLANWGDHFCPVPLC